MDLDLDSLPGAGNSDGLLQQLRDDLHSNADYLTDQIDAICEEADRLCRNNEPATAETLYRKALNVCETSPLQISAPHGFKIYRRLAELLESQQRADEACLNYLTALTLVEKANAAGIEPACIATVHHQLGRLLADSDELTRAVKHYRQALALLSHPQELDDAGKLRPQELRAQLEENLGDSQWRLGNHASALGGFSRALQCRRQCLDEETLAGTPKVCRLFEKLSAAFEKLGEHDSAHACRQRLQKIQSRPNSL